MNTITQFSKPFDFFSFYIANVLARGQRINRRLIYFIALLAMTSLLIFWIQLKWNTVALQTPLMLVNDQSESLIDQQAGITDMPSTTSDMPFMSSIVNPAPINNAFTDNDTLDEKRFSKLSQIATKRPAVADARNEKILTSNVAREKVSHYISQRYRVARAPTDLVVKAAFITGRELGLDPLLILSVMAIESRFNPYAESIVGAKGLMQVMAKIHSDKFAHFGGTSKALDPITNLKVGALILKEYIVNTGSVTSGLRKYVGAAALPTDGGYGAKVLAERARLRQVVNNELKGLSPISAPKTVLASTKKSRIKETFAANIEKKLAMNNEKKENKNNEPGVLKQLGYLDAENT